jgi:rRNA-processing protein FCF1
MSIEQKKYKRLRKELQFVQSELEYVQEVLSEWHLIFEEYHRDYCKKKEIDLEQLNKQASKKIDQLIPKPVIKETGVVSYENKKDKDVYKKLYKQIARKLHPDLGGDEKEFQEATTAMQEKNFEKILDICDKHDILIEIDKEMLSLIQKQISDIKKQIKKEKSTYSWSLYSCVNDKCKDNVVKKFLKHLFNYEEKK